MTATEKGKAQLFFPSSNLLFLLHQVLVVFLFLFRQFSLLAVDFAFPASFPAAEAAIVVCKLG